MDEQNQTVENKEPNDTISIFTALILLAAVGLLLLFCYSTWHFPELLNQALKLDSINGGSNLARICSLFIYNRILGTLAGIVSALLFIMLLDVLRNRKNSLAEPSPEN